MRRLIIIGSVLILLLASGVTSQVPIPQGNQVRPVYPRPDQFRGDRSSFLSQLCLDLTGQAEYLANSSYDYFMGWNGIISNSEQAVLFKTEEFAAASRLFSKLVRDQTNYFNRGSLRTNLHSAFLYVQASFHELETIMGQGGMREGFGMMRRDGRRFQPRTYGGRPVGPFGLAECRRILNRMESEFSVWR